MTHKLLLISGDARLTARLQNALGDACTVMTADGRGGDALARRFDPDGLIIDAGAHTGAQTILENIAALHEQFPALPLVVIGDEMSAQMILSSFRAGANDFLDRESSDAELRDSILSRLRGSGARPGTHAASHLIDILSPSPSDADYDFALNMAVLIAAGSVDRRVLLLDFSLPASPAHVALGLEMKFAIPAAIRDISRLDRTFLDSAVARAPETGLHVLPLVDDSGHADSLPALRDVLVLLQILRSLFDVVVIYWGAFSRQAALGGLGGDNRHAFLCCNQRFGSIRNGKALFAEIAAMDGGHAAPVLVIHQTAPNMTPAPDDVARAVGAARHIVLRTQPGELIQAHNSGRPLCLAGPSHYADALRMELMAHGLAPDPRPDKGRVMDLMQWLRKATS